MVRIAQKVSPAPPAYLLDQSGQVPRLQKLLPGIFGSYQLTDTPGLYRRK